MNLRLASYSESGKFEKFLELGKDFGYFGDFIIVNSECDENYLDVPSLCLDIMNAEGAVMAEFGGDQRFYCAKKDPKDPLNRFNGLFDGRSYSGGRFVLELEGEDNIYSAEMVKRHNQ